MDPLEKRVDSMEQRLASMEENVQFLKDLLSHIHTQLQDFKKDVKN